MNQSIPRSQGDLDWEYAYRSVNQPINGIDRLVLFFGSSLIGWLDTYRGDMIAVMGETAPGTDRTIDRLYQSINQSEEGKAVLYEKPRLIDNRLIDRLIDLPTNTLGYQYAKFMKSNNFFPSSRTPVQFINRPNDQSTDHSANRSINQSISPPISELDAAYIVQRYRESHDIWHVLTNTSTTIFGELTQKVFEFSHTGFPNTGISSIGGVSRLKSTEEVNQYFSRSIPWGIRAGKQAKCLLAVYWEHRWMQDVQEIRKELNIEVFQDEFIF